MELKRTITSIFIMPTLGINRDKLTEHGFINAYSKMIGDVDHENCIFILFKPSNPEKFQQFIDSEYERTDILISDSHIKDYVILTYHLNVKYNKDFQLIRQGKYSKTSKEFQNLFPEKIKIKNKEKLSIQFRIFNKTDDLRDYWEERTGIYLKEDMEMWDGYREEEETLNIEKL